MCDKIPTASERFIIAITLHFARGQIDRTVEVTDVAIPQQLVLQHGAQRRRDRHRELERHFVADQPLHHGNQRQISFGDGFEEPVFLEKLFVLRVPDERQMRVKNERERTGGHCRFQNDDCRLWKDDAVAQS